MLAIQKQSAEPKFPNNPTQVSGQAPVPLRGVSHFAPHDNSKKPYSPT